MAQLRNQSELQEKIRDTQAGHTKQLRAIGQQAAETLQRTLDRHDEDKAVQGYNSDYHMHTGRCNAQVPHSDARLARPTGMVGRLNTYVGPIIDLVLVGSVRGANVLTSRIITMLPYSMIHITIYMREYFNYTL